VKTGNKNRKNREKSVTGKKPEKPVTEKPGENR